jgi:phage minor structural protein
MYNSPVLYADFQTTVGHPLDECISCVCTEEVNTSFELVVEYPATGELASQITAGKFIVCKPNPYDYPQYFHIYKVSKTTQFMITVYAEHISYAFNHFVCRPNTTYEDEETSITALMYYLNSQSNDNPTPIQGYQMTFTSNVTSLSRWTVPNHTEAKNVMSNAVKLYGGEWKFNNNGASLMVSRGQDRGVTLSNATNLISLSSDNDITGVYTHIFPFWKGIDENGNEVIVYSDPEFVSILSETRTRFKPYIYDCSQYFSVKPQSGELYERALDFGNLNYTILGNSISGFDAEIVQRGKTIEGAYLSDADHIEIGDTIYINIPEINLSTSEKVTATKYDVLRDRLISVTIGKKQGELTDIFVKLQKRDDEEESTADETKEEPKDFSKEIPDKVVKVSDNEVYALYDNSTTKVIWTAEGEGNERHNFVKKVVAVEEETGDDDDSNTGGNDNDVG